MSGRLEDTASLQANKMTASGIGVAFHTVAFKQS